MEYIEIDKFGMKEEFTKEQFIEAEKSVRNGLIRSPIGFINRELRSDF